MVRAFAGDSTITSGLGTCEILVVLGTKGPTGGSRPHRGATNGASVSNIPHGVASAFPALPVPDHLQVPSCLSCRAMRLAALSLDPRDLLESFGPWATIGLFLIIFAETGLLIGFFLPGDSLLFAAGILASQGNLNIAVIALGCFLAAVIGDQVGYTIGHRAGPALFRRPDSRIFKQKYVDRTKEFFEKHGPKTILLARFVPIVRTFAPVLAGVGEMKRRTFTTHNIIGGFV